MVVSLRAWLATADEEALREVRAVMDRHTAVPDEVTDEAITRALGEELRRVREAAGWSRAEMCSRLPSGIGDRTLLAYEHGIRGLTILRLIEVSEALGVDGPTMLGNALQRARLYLDRLKLRVDVRALAVDDNLRFRPMRQWARNKLSQVPSGIAEVDPSAVKELAAMMGCAHTDLARHLANFIPPAAPDSDDASDAGEEEVPGKSSVDKHPWRR
jgi:transcriptional regulator with XRE-family HTH domain